MLNLNTEGGDFTPWVKFNGKAGRWYVKGENGDVEVDKPVFVADLENIKTGWLYFAAGQAPERVMDLSLERAAPKPDHGDFKRGFMLNLFSDAQFGGVVELSANSQGISRAISALYKQYDQDKATNVGKLPVVDAGQSLPVTNKHGTNYEPVFTIVKWVQRPDAFDGVDEPSNDATATQAPTQAAPAASSVSEF